ncbi:uncharacterized protein LOC118559542 [Fundulus heteroclitus]|uniref:uncharacterized protein LOC118559542 n=1 Tax=Fundulus heteroclitus TaxID=8078 RepID=UPI00165B00D3|nr:uncharacterized protein LOC118559542 [Fundulus heteroclitus]
MVIEETEEDLEAKAADIADLHAKIRNACFKLIQEAAQRRGKDVHIVDMYVVPTWKSKMGEPEAALLRDLSKDIIIPAWSQQQGKADHYLLCVLKPAKKELFLLDSLKPDGFGDSHFQSIFSDLAHHIAPGHWTTKVGKDIESFPHQITGNCCGIFILMYALSISTGAPFLFTERDMVHIRKWWCISLMERFQIEGHGQRFAHWTSETTALLKGSLEPIYRIPKSRKRKHEVVFPKDDRCFILELSACLLSEILGEVVLLEGDQAYMTLGLVCTTFRDIMSTVGFRRRVHFQWFDIFYRCC